MSPRHGAIPTVAIMFVSFVMSILFKEIMGIALPNDMPFAQNHLPGAPCNLPLPPLQKPNTSSSQHGRSTFNQPLHHPSPELGSFPQSFLWNSTFWRPRAPVVVFLPGEDSIDGFAVYTRPDYSIVGVIAEHLGAAVVIPEHRYYGSSSLFPQPTTANLTYLTVENSLKDIVNLAKDFTAPWTDVPSTAEDVPWILIGGSYSAAQTAWIANIMGGTFWAYLSSSPIVQAIPSYWAYLLPLMEHGRESCVQLFSQVVQLIDAIIDSADERSIRTVKEIFGLAEMDTLDFLYQLSYRLTYWSEGGLGKNNTTIDTICSWVEGYQDGHAKLEGMFDMAVPPQHRSSGKQARSDWATRHEQTLYALYTYAEGFRENLAPHLCIAGVCQNSSDPLQYALLPLDFEGRKMTWLQCNDMISGYVTGAPVGATSNPLVSRFLTDDYFIRQCALFFPSGPNGETYGAAKGMTADSFNAWTGGWSPTKARRIIYSSGEMDVWREMSVASKLRPGGPLQSAPQQDIVVHAIATGWHHSDLITRNVELSEEVRQVRDQEVEQICTWVQQWPGYS